MNQSELSFSILIIAGTILFSILIFLIIIFMFQIQKKNKKYITERLILKSQFSQTLLQSQLEIKEQTLQQISHELHDNLGQVASLIKINLNTLQLGDPAKAAEKIEDTKELTRQLITDLKSLSVSLGADRISQTGLAKAIQTEVERLNKTGQYTANFQQTGSVPAMDNDKIIILFRMAQEALNNIVKHSSASHISVLMNTSENLFTLALNDNGVGFDPEDKLKNGGAGLVNLQNRARLINAQFTIKSSPGNGSLVTIEMPL